MIEEALPSHQTQLWQPFVCCLRFCQVFAMSCWAWWTNLGPLFCFWPIENELTASEEGDVSLPMVGVAEAENSPAGQFGLAHSITLGQLQVFQMASLGSVCFHCQLLFMSHHHHYPHQVHVERPGTPGTAAGGFLMEVTFSGTFLLKGRQMRELYCEKHCRPKGIGL